MIIEVTLYPCDQSNKRTRNTTVCWARLNVRPHVRSLQRVSLTNKRLRICKDPIVLRSFSRPCHSLPVLLLLQPHSPRSPRDDQATYDFWRNGAKTAKWGTWNGRNGTVFPNSYLLLGFHHMLKKVLDTSHIVTNPSCHWQACDIHSRGNITNQVLPSSKPTFLPTLPNCLPLRPVLELQKGTVFQCSNGIKWVSKTGVHRQQSQKQKTISCLFGSISLKDQLYSAQIWSNDFTE